MYHNLLLSTPECLTFTPEYHPYCGTESKYVKYISIEISNYLFWFYDSTYMYGSINDDAIEDIVYNVMKWLVSTPESCVSTTELNLYLHILPLKQVGLCPVYKLIEFNILKIR